LLALTTVGEADVQASDGNTPNIAHNTWVIVRLCSSWTLANWALGMLLSFERGREAISSSRASASVRSQFRGAETGSVGLGAEVAKQRFVVHPV
jgi:hypothetical protein